MNIPESILGLLNEEQKKKVGAASSVEEILAIVKDFGLDLTDEQLEGLAGGTGPLGTGPLQTGPLGTGPLGTGPLQTGPLGTGPLDSCDPPLGETGPLKTGPLGETGPLKTGPLGSCDPS